jgi:hypothetical protein
MRLMFVAATLLPLAACGNGDEGPGVAGSGSGNTRSYAVDGFTEVGLDGPDDAQVSVGASFSVRAEGEAKVLDRLRIERKGDTLRIGRRRDGFFGSDGDGTARIFVTMPAITGARLAGSGNMSVDRAAGETMAMSLAGSGNMNVAALAVKRAEMSIAGSGNVRAGGTADALHIKIAGSGNVAAEALRANAAEVSIAGSGDVKARVTGNAKVKVAGSGDVDLGPDARCETRMMGSGAVRCGG